jgi:hypothetical protein
MVLVILLYVGLLATFVGAVCLLMPFARLGIPTRRRAGLVLAAGAALVLAGACVGRPRSRAGGEPMKINQFAPVYDFNEVHTIQVHASVARTYQAVTEVTPREIRFFRTLMGIRALPARLLGGDRHPPLLKEYTLHSHQQREPESHTFSAGPQGHATVVVGAKSSLVYETRSGAVPSPAPEILRAYVDAVQKMGFTLVSQDRHRVTLRLGARGAATWVEVNVEEEGRRYTLTILRPGETSPILDVFTSSDFQVLAEDENREILIGAVSAYGGASGKGVAPGIGDREAFLAFDEPGYVKITCNFLVQEDAPGWSSVRTETRVSATDPSARRRFGVYWRLIYPGSATIRREWLKAIRRRAEAELAVEAVS